MRTGILAGGIVVLILGLIGAGAGAAYSSVAGEAMGAVVAVLGLIAAGVGAAAKST